MKIKQSFKSLLRAYPIAASGLTLSYAYTSSVDETGVHVKFLDFPDVDVPHGSLYSTTSELHAQQALVWLITTLLALNKRIPMPRASSSAYASLTEAQSLRILQHNKDKA